MTDEQAKEIREALEAATPGPWEARAWGIDTNDKYSVAQIGEDEKEIATVWKGIRYPNMPEISDEEAKVNAHLIANAPEWLRQLLAEREALKAEVERLERHIENIERAGYV